jgi:hypothetical protein
MCASARPCVRLKSKCLHVVMRRIVGHLCVTSGKKQEISPISTDKESKYLVFMLIYRVRKKKYRVVVTWKKQIFIWILYLTFILTGKLYLQNNNIFLYAKLYAYRKYILLHTHYVEHLIYRVIKSLHIFCWELYWT